MTSLWNDASERTNKMLLGGIYSKQFHSLLRLRRWRRRLAVDPEAGHKEARWRLSQNRNAEVQGRKGSEGGGTAGYLDKDTLRQEASQCGAAGRRTARQADVELR